MRPTLLIIIVPWIQSLWRFLINLQYKRLVFGWLINAYLRLRTTFEDVLSLTCRTLYSYYLGSLMTRLHLGLSFGALSNRHAVLSLVVFSPHSERHLLPDRDGSMT